MNLNVPNRQRLLVILAGAAVLLLILDSLVFTPLTKTWQAHAAEITQLQKSVANGRSLIARRGAQDGVLGDGRGGRSDH